MRKVDMLPAERLLGDDVVQADLARDYEKDPSMFAVKYTIQIFDPIGSRWSFLGPADSVPTFESMDAAKTAADDIAKALGLSEVLVRVKELRLKTNAATNKS